MISTPSVSACASETARPAQKPRLAIALGDPAGIGPEVILKALAHPKVVADCEITLVGSKTLLEQTYQTLTQLGQIAAPPDAFSLIDIPLPHPITPGHPSATSGALSFTTLNRAIDLALGNQADAVVTAPIAKSAWKAAGHLYPGQTELLAERTGSRDYGMIFLGRSPHTQWTLRTLLATTHIPLSQVPQALTPELMTQKLSLLLRFLQDRCGLERPRVAIAGLNPHSGEQGQLGSEEQDWLIPWLEQARQQFPQAWIDGPIPPDSLWVAPGQAWYGKLPSDSVKVLSQPYDAYLALYHDQGLIPVKLMAFDRAVNTTIGLPFLRTSPDHGTAFDIAGQGKAAETSMVEAIAWAKRLI